MMDGIINAPPISNLKKMRHDKQITASELAEKTGISLARIQHYESRYRDINKAEALIVYKLAVGLDCDISEILELPKEMKMRKKSISEE